MPRVHKYPRIIKSAASDADPRGPRLLQHRFGRLRRRNVTVADHRNGLDRLHYRADARQIDASAETLLAGTPMNENRRHSNLLQRPRKIRSGDILIIPTEAHLGSYG